MKKSSLFSPLRQIGIRPWQSACLLMVCLLFSFVLNACATAAPDPRADVVVAVPAGAQAQALSAAALVYQQATGLRVAVTEVASETYADQAAAVLLAGLDRYDLLLLPADALPRWAAYHVILPFEVTVDGVPLAENRDIAPWLPMLVVDDQLYGLPTEPDVDVLWYRADLLSAAGLAVPYSWTGFEQAAAALNSPPERYGAVIAGGALDAGSEFTAVLVGFGGAVMSADYRVQIDSPAARRALEWYAGLRNKTGTVPRISDHFTRSDVVRLLQSGRAGLGLAPLSAAGVLQDCDASPSVCQGGWPQLAWTWLPGTVVGEITGADELPCLSEISLGRITPTGRLSAWVVPRGAANPAAAANFAGWLTGKEGAQAWASGGGTPAHRSVLVQLERPEKALGQTASFHLAFPPITNGDQIWSAVHAAVHAAVAGDQSPDQALLEADIKMEKALRQAGY